MSSDETLVVNIRLSVPASDQTIQAPPSTGYAEVYSLPIDARTQAEAVDEDDETLTHDPPELLLLLLASMQIFLDASYTAPRLSDPPSSINARVAGSDDISLLSNHVAPASDRTDAAYQIIALQVASSTGETTRMYSNTWNALEVPLEVETGEISKASTEKSDEVSILIKNGGEITYAAKSKGAGDWVVDWRCKLPISEYIIVGHWLLSFLKLHYDV